MKMRNQKYHINSVQYYLGFRMHWYKITELWSALKNKEERNKIFA